MSSNGIRTAELSRLVNSDINWDTWEVTLPAPKSKSSKARTSIIPEEIRDDFKSCFPPINGGALIHRGEGIPISPVGLGNVFREYCRIAGLGRRNVHLLRAYAILKILESSGNNYELVRKICGWDSKEMEKYMGGMNKEKKEVAVNMSWKNTHIDSSREYDMLAERVEGALEGRVSSWQELASKTRVSYEWIHKAFIGKTNKDIEKLMQIVVYLEHYVTIASFSRGKKPLVKSIKQLALTAVG